MCWGPASGLPQGIVWPRLTSPASCWRSPRTELFTAPSPTGHRPGRLGISLTRCSDTTCAANPPLDSSWWNVYISAVSHCRKVFLSLRLRQCRTLFLNLGFQKPTIPTAQARPRSFRRSKVLYDGAAASALRVLTYQIDSAFSRRIFEPYPSRSIKS